MRRSIPVIAAVVAAAMSADVLAAQAFNSGLPSGSTCTGDIPSLACGTSGASGSVTLAPGGGTQFGWVSTNGGSLRDPLSISGTTNGTTLTTGAFTATAGQSLSFNFNYITSDGAGFSDYAFVRLLGGSSAITLFTARTTTSGNTVPGFGLPGIAPGVTLVPASTPINVVPGGVGPTFAPGNVSGCFATGCGFTGWLAATYVVPDAGTNYQLEFNVFNVDDQKFQSALAFDYTQGAGGTPTIVANSNNNGNTTVPEPSTYLLMAAGLGGIVVMQRRRRQP